MTENLALRDRMSSLLLLGCVTFGASCAQEPSLYVETFDGALDREWRWVSATQDGWRQVNGRLLIRTQPGGIYMEENQGKDLLLREPPEVSGSICVEVELSNRPEGLYENAGLILYVDDDNYVFVNKEAFPGHRDPPVVLQVVNEIGGVPADEDPYVSYDRDAPVRLRMRIDDETVTGLYRESEEGPWLEIGVVPRPTAGRLSIGVQTSYGVPDTERWAEFDNFKVIGGG